MSVQYFKGDDNEKKFDASAQTILAALSNQLDEFFAGAYRCKPLGDLLWENNRAPLAKAIKQEVFRDAFAEIFDAFLVAGTFESYISVFKKIFGEAVEVTFTVPGPGILDIDIVADGFEASNFIARHIEGADYVYDNVVYLDGDGTDNIVFQTVKGFTAQYELEQMLKEMVPIGISTHITLSTG